MSVLHMPAIPFSTHIEDSIELTYNNKNESSATINKTLQTYLHTIKCEIDGQQDAWDRYKKYTNPYEYIHTPVPLSKMSICKLKPLSRSFYKMIEMANIIDLLDLLPTPFKSFHFAEGPGGFIEAICQLTKNNIVNTHYAMTLIDNNDITVPGWKKSRNFLENHSNVIIDSGADKTGNLFIPENLKHCMQKYKQQIHLVTADGGFDFSTDFNKQELSGLQLLLAQVIYAITVQKLGGYFIIKFFDTFTQPSIDIIYILSIIYTDIQIIKPCTSRHANSEKYIICNKFCLADSSALVEKLSTILFDMLKNDKPPKRFLKSPPPYYFVVRLEECNAILGQQQLESISSTLSLIENSRNDKIENMKKNNIQKCIHWCQKNRLPYHKTISTTNIFLDK